MLENKMEIKKTKSKKFLFNVIIVVITLFTILSIAITYAYMAEAFRTTPTGQFDILTVGIDYSDSTKTTSTFGLLSSVSLTTDYDMGMSGVITNTTKNVNNVSGDSSLDSYMRIKFELTAYEDVEKTVPVSAEDQAKLDYVAQTVKVAQNSTHFVKASDGYIYYCGNSDSSNKLKWEIGTDIYINGELLLNFPSLYFNNDWKGRDVDITAKVETFQYNYMTVNLASCATVQDQANCASSLMLNYNEASGLGTNVRTIETACCSSSRLTFPSDANFTTTISGNNLSTLKVYSGGKKLVAGIDYTFNSSTGQLSVQAISTSILVACDPIIISFVDSTDNTHVYQQLQVDSATYPSYVYVPELEGYSFCGYYTGTNGTGTQIYNSTGECISEAITTNTLYSYFEHYDVLLSYGNTTIPFDGADAFEDAFEYSTTLNAYKTTITVFDNFNISPSATYSVRSDMDLTITSDVTSIKTLTFNPSADITNIFSAVGTGSTLNFKNINLSMEATPTYSARCAYISGSNSLNIGTATILTGFSSSSNGGAIYATGTGDCIISGVNPLIQDITIQNCLSSALGGAVYASNTGTIKIQNAKLLSNTSTNGGAVYFSAGTNSTVKGSQFTSNSATTSDGGAICNLGNTTISSSTFSNNSAQTNGGAISSTGVSSVLALKGGELYNNTAQTNGGAIYSEGTFNMSGGEIYGNSSPSGGGVTFNGTTFNMSGGTIGRIGNPNTSTSSAGGGIRVTAGTMNFSGGVIGSATASTTASTTAGCYANGAYTGSGGISVMQNSTLNMFSTATTTPIIAYNCGNLTSNTTYSGGGLAVYGYASCNIYAQSDAVTVPEIRYNNASRGGGIYTYNEETSTPTALILSACKVYGNSAEFGGGIFLRAQNSTRYSSLQMQSNLVEINNNVAVNGSGGVHIDNNCTITMSGGKIYNNSVTSTTASQGYGGGLSLINNSIGTLNGGNIYNNTASLRGGGVFCATGTTLTIDGVKIYGNNANGVDSATQGGGGIYAEGTAQINFYSGQIGGNNYANANKALTGFGGGILLCGSSQLTMTGGVIGSSSATTTATSSACGNIAKSGGGIWIGGTATVTINSAENTHPTISYNYASYNAYATGDGGGIKNISTSALSINTSATEYNSTNNAIMSYNGSAGGRGGALYNSNSNAVTIKNTYFAGSVSAVRPDGCSSFTLSYCYFENNENNALWLTDTLTSASLSNTTFTGSIGNGATICCPTTIDNCEFSNNVNVGILVDSNVSISITNSRAFGNDRGFQFRSSSNATITNCEIYNNGSSSVSGGGGIYVDGASLTIVNSQIYGNTAQYGGGIWACNNTIVTMGSGTIGKTGSPNTAVYGGGAVCLETSSMMFTGGTIGDLFKDSIATASAGQSANTAQYGGGIYLNGTNGATTLTMQSTTNTTPIIAYNVSTGSNANLGGGGIFAHNNAIVTINAGVGATTVPEIRYNSAICGGAIHIFNARTTGTELAPTSTSLTLSACNIHHNKAVTSGAIASKNSALYNSADVTINNNLVQIYQNTATTSSSAVENAGGTLTISAGLIYNNSAPTLGALGTNGVSCVTNISGTAQIYNNELTNASVGNGGGIWCSAGTVNMSGGEVYGNVVSNFGGGAYFYSNSTFNLSGGTIGKTNNPNIANYGGGVMICDGATLNFTGGVVGDSTKATCAGTTSNLCANLALIGGGGIYIKDSGSSAEIKSTSSTTPIIAYNGSSGTDANYSGGGLTLTNIVSCVITRTNDATTSPEIRYNTAYRGGGIYMYNKSTTGTDNATKTYTTLTLTACNMHHNSAPLGGAMLVRYKNEYNTCQVLINGANVKIYENTSTNNELGVGGICISGGEITMSAGEIYNNNGTIKAGAIYSYNSASYFTMTGGRIYNNTATDGGAIYMTNGTVSISGGTIGEANAKATNVAYSNYATNGGAIYVAGGTLNINHANSVIAKNKAENGGAIYVAGGTTNLTIGSIYGNYATNGGAIYVNGGTLNASGTTIGNNSYPNEATSYGGGVYVLSGTATISSGAVIGTTTTSLATNVSYANKAQYGGGLFVGGGTVTISGGTIGYNNALVGGGVYINSTSATTLSGGNIQYNSASHPNMGGGGVYVAGSGTSNFTGINIKYNSAENGGGIYEAGNILITGGDINNNTATNGGGIYIASGGLSITNNNAKMFSNTATNGGGVYQNGGSFIFSAGYIGDSSQVTPATNVSYSNSAQCGGGIYIVTGTFNLNGGVVAYNYASSLTKGGGGIYTMSPISITGGIVRYNFAVNGGGIYLDIQPINSIAYTVTMSNGSIIGNKASSSGGGVYISFFVHFEMSGGIIGDTTTTTATTSSCSNWAEYGGGIYVGGYFKMNSTSQISRNFANTYGGGILIQFDENNNDNIPKFSMIDGTISYNASPLGGGVKVQSNNLPQNSNNMSRAIIDLSGGAISNNNATSQGGGIWLNNDLTIIEGCEISNNTSTSVGGGIYITQIANRNTNIEFQFNGGEIKGNSSANGGGIYIQAGTANLSGGEIYANYTASGGYGGGIYQNGGELVIAGNVEVGKAGQPNYAPSGYGGGVHVQSGKCTIGGSAVIGSTTNSCANSTSNCANYAAYGGGLNNFSQTELVMNGGTIGYNWAVSMCGGVRTNGVTNLKGGVVCYNGAPSYAGVCVFDSTGDIKIDGVEICNNQTTNGDGGGFVVYNGVRSAVIYSGSIHHNSVSSSKAGGGICLTSSGAILSMYGGNVYGNYATNGGGVFMKAGTIFNLYDGVIGGDGTAENANIATTDGGGIFNRGTINMFGGCIGLPSATTSADTTHFANKAKYGGGVVLRDGTFNMSAGIISYNYATGNAGGVCSGFTTNFTGGYICYNYSPLGAGIVVYNNAQLTMSDVSIFGNKSTSHGAGLYVWESTTNSASLTITSAEIYNNESIGGNGGGILQNSTNATLTITTCNCYENSAVNGGGIYQKGGNVVYGSGYIQGNTATTHGGGVYINAGTFSNTSASIAGNTPENIYPTS